MQRRWRATCWKCPEWKCPECVIAYDALRRASTSIIIAARREVRSGDPGRAAAQLAKRFNSELVMFPSHHGGFNKGGGPYGGQPEAFTAKLSHVLERNR